MSNQNNSGRIFAGKGYYIALILCAAAIGITGYLYSRNLNETRETLQMVGSEPASTAGDPTQAPTEPQNQEVTLVYTIQLPADRTENYVLSIHQSGNQLMEDTEIDAGTESIQLELTGSGVQYYELYIDGSYYKTEKVEFTVNG